MKKIKKIWIENKVLLVLAIILILCIAVFCIVSITYFYGSSSSVYGNRLDPTKNTPINDRLISDIKQSISENENVNKVTVNLMGIVLYINISFIDDMKIEDAKKIAEDTLELFNDDELNVYDIEFSISTLLTETNTKYTLMGARNANGNGSIVWNNYNIEESAN